jgi:hypothetical protein
VCSRYIQWRTCFTGLIYIGLFVNEWSACGAIVRRASARPDQQRSQSSSHPRQRIRGTWLVCKLTPPPRYGRGRSVRMPHKLLRTVTCLAQPALARGSAVTYHTAYHHHRRQLRPDPDKRSWRAARRPTNQHEISRERTACVLHHRTRGIQEGCMPGFGANCVQLYTGCCRDREGNIDADWDMPCHLVAGALALVSGHMTLPRCCLSLHVLTGAFIETCQSTDQQAR